MWHLNEVQRVPYFISLQCLWHTNRTQYINLLITWMHFNLRISCNVWFKDRGYDCCVCCWYARHCLSFRDWYCPPSFLNIACSFDSWRVVFFFFCAVYLYSLSVTLGFANACDITGLTVFTAVGFSHEDDVLGKTMHITFQVLLFGQKPSVKLFKVDQWKCRKYCLWSLDTFCSYRIFNLLFIYFF